MTKQIAQTADQRLMRDRPSFRILPGVSCLFLALVAVTAGCSGFATTTGPVQPNAAPGAIGQADSDDADSEGALTERQQRQIDLIAPILLESTNGPDDGRLLAAAQELLALEIDRADQILEQALRGNQPNQMLAVLRAMITSETTPQRLVQAALDILPTAPLQAQDTLWRLLAQHEADVLANISALVQDQSAAPEHRLNAIGALGAFRTRDAADQLIALLNEQREEPEAITAAACEALTRLTRLPYGNRPQTWRSWWVQARNQTREQWLVDQVQRLATERAELERELTLQRQRVRRVEQRVIEVLRDLFRALPTDVDQQLAPLPTLLDDELSVVREFAIERIRFISRDHEIPAALINALSARLDDPQATIRTRAARLLNELNYTELSERLARGLGDETSIDVIQTSIELLTERPTATALPALIRRIGDPTVSDAACEAVWKCLFLHGTEEIDAEQRAALIDSVRDASAVRTTPQLTRLAVYLSEDAEFGQAARFLESDDPAMRTAVAEALAQRSNLTLLRARADDTAVYPSLIRAIAQSDATLATLQSVVELRPPEETLTNTWRESITSVLAKLAPADVIGADDLLMQANADAALRIELLSRVATMPTEQLPAADRVEVATRLGRFFVEREQYADAHVALELITTANGSAELQQLRFKAALLAGHYNRAAEFQPTAEAWIELLADLAGGDETLAKRVQTEIDQRFGATLTEELRTRLDTLRQQLDGESQTPPEPTAADASNAASEP